MTIYVKTLAPIFLAASFISFVHAQTIPTLPDPIKTPGALHTTNLAEITAPGYDRAHRVWHDKANTLRKYNLPLSFARLVEDDDRYPVCLGGDNANPLNHWPQNRTGPWNAHDKDHLEDKVCEMVKSGEMTIEAGDGIFAGDWRDGYIQVFGRPPRSAE